jgi:hypothetical protein
VQTHGTSFLNAINSRQQAFGGNEHSMISDLTNATAAVSFISQISMPNNNYNNFSAESGFELSPLIQRGDAVLVVWVPNYSLIKPLNQFSARRGHRDTVLRLAVPVTSN